MPKRGPSSPPNPGPISPPAEPLVPPYGQQDDEYDDTPFFDPIHHEQDDEDEDDATVSTTVQQDDEDDDATVSTTVQQDDDDDDATVYVPPPYVQQDDEDDDATVYVPPPSGQQDDEDDDATVPPSGQQDEIVEAFGGNELAELFGFASADASGDRSGTGQKDEDGPVSTDLPGPDLDGAEQADKPQDESEEERPEFDADSVLAQAAKQLVEAQAYYDKVIEKYGDGWKPVGSLAAREIEHATASLRVAQLNKAVAEDIVGLHATTTAFNESADAIKEDVKEFNVLAGDHEEDVKEFKVLAGALKEEADDFFEGGETLRVELGGTLVTNEAGETHILFPDQASLDAYNAYFAGLAPLVEREDNLYGDPDDPNDNGMLGVIQGDSVTLYGDPDDPNDNGMLGVIQGDSVTLYGDPDDPNDNGISGAIKDRYAVVYGDLDDPNDGKIGTVIQAGLLSERAASNLRQARTQTPGTYEAWLQGSIERSARGPFAEEPEYAYRKWVASENEKARSGGLMEEEKALAIAQEQGLAWYSGPQEEEKGLAIAQEQGLAWYSGPQEEEAQVAWDAYQKAVATGAIDISPENELYFNPIRLAQNLSVSEASALGIYNKQYDSLNVLAGSEAYNPKTQGLNVRAYLDGGGEVQTLVDAGIPIPDFGGPEDARGGPMPIGPNSDLFGSALAFEADPSPENKARLEAARAKTSLSNRELVAQYIGDDGKLINTEDELALAHKAYSENPTDATRSDLEIAVERNRNAKLFKAALAFEADPSPENKARLEAAREGTSQAVWNAVYASLSSAFSSVRSSPGFWSKVGSKLYDETIERSANTVAGASKPFIELYASHGSTSPEAYDRVQEVLESTDNLEEAAAALGMGTGDEWQEWISDPVTDSSHWEIKSGRAPRSTLEAMGQDTFRGMDAEELEAAQIFYMLVDGGLYSTTATRSQRVGVFESSTGGRETYATAKVEERRQAATEFTKELYKGTIPLHHTMRDWDTAGFFGNTINILGDLAFFVPIARGGSLGYSALRASGRTALGAAVGTVGSTTKGAVYGAFNPVAGIKEVGHLFAGSFRMPRSALGTRWHTGRLHRGFASGDVLQDYLRRDVVSGAVGSQPRYIKGAPASGLEPTEVTMKTPAFSRTLEDSPSVFRHTGPEDAPYSGYLYHGSPNIHDLAQAEDITELFAAPTAHLRFDDASSGGALTRFDNEPGVAVIDPNDIDIAKATKKLYKGKLETETTIDAADLGIRQIGTVQLPVPKKRLYDKATNDNIREVFDKKTGKLSGYKRFDKDDPKKLLEEGPPGQFKGRIKTLWFRTEAVYGSRSVPHMDDIGLKKIRLRAGAEADILRPGFGSEARFGDLQQTGLRLNLSQKWLDKIKAELIAQRKADITPRVVTDDGWMFTLGPRGKLWANFKKSGPGDWGHWRPVETRMTTDLFAREGKLSRVGEDPPVGKEGTQDGRIRGKRKNERPGGVEPEDSPRDIEDGPRLDDSRRGLREMSEGITRQGRSIAGGAYAGGVARQAGGARAKGTEGAARVAPGDETIEIEAEAGEAPPEGRAGLAERIIMTGRAATTTSKRLDTEGSVRTDTSERVATEEDERAATTTSKRLDTEGSVRTAPTSRGGSPTVRRHEPPPGEIPELPTVRLHEPPTRIPGPPPPEIPGPPPPWIPGPPPPTRIPGPPPPEIPGPPPPWIPGPPPPTRIPGPPPPEIPGPPPPWIPGPPPPTRIPGPPPPWIPGPPPPTRIPGPPPPEIPGPPPPWIPGPPPPPGTPAPPGKPKPKPEPCPPPPCPPPPCPPPPCPPPPCPPPPCPPPPCPPPPCPPADETKTKTSGQYAELVAWRQGKFYKVADLDTKQVTTQKHPPPGVPSDGKPFETFRVLTTDDDPPVKVAYPMGVVDVTATHKGVRFRGRKRKRKGPSRTNPKRQSIAGKINQAIADEFRRQNDATRMPAAHESKPPSQLSLDRGNRS